jgi:hypothetical protein
MTDATARQGDLLAIGAAEEVGISSRRPDGSLRPPVTIWAVVVDGHLYVRSAYGAENGWFRRLVASGAGRVSSGGATADVVARRPSEPEATAVDRAYEAKYARYPGIVAGMVGPQHHDVTLRLDPA